VAELRHTARARADLIDIWVSIAADNPGSADRVFERIEERASLLARWPQAGAACPAIGPDARMLVEPPYLILYRVIADGVQIVRVLHGARDIDSALFAAGLE
jgi:toxin ParE1/3/4